MSDDGRDGGRTGGDREGRRRRDFEERLDELREEAARTGGAGAAAEGTAAEGTGRASPPGGRARGRDPRRDAPGYYGRPVVKPPVWTWEIPLYFFVGGTGGGAAIVALAALVAGSDPAVAVRALLLAALAAVVSPVLLVLDLGRPGRFLNMLRVFKWRSPMSVGAWTLVAFSGFALPAAALVTASPAGALGSLVVPLTVGAALTGALLATYTGVLLACSTIPVWRAFGGSLPVHFGIAGWGTAAALLELTGLRTPTLYAIGIFAATAEIGLGTWMELGQRGRETAAAREGRAGVMLRAGAALTGPVALLLRLLGLVAPAAAAFAAGALLSRYGWLAAGRASALDPQAVLAEPDVASEGL